MDVVLGICYVHACKRVNAWINHVHCLLPSKVNQYRVGVAVVMVTNAYGGTELV